MGQPIFEENGQDDFRGIDIMRAVRSFDPCLPCGVHMYLGGGKTLKAGALADVRGARLMDDRQHASWWRASTCCSTRCATSSWCRRWSTSTARASRGSWRTTRSASPGWPTTSSSRTCCCSTGCTRCRSSSGCAGARRGAAVPRAHGGDVELLGVEEGRAAALEGSCNGCPSSTATLKNAIEDAIQRVAPDVEEIEAEGAVEPSGLLQIEIACPPGSVTADSRARPAHAPARAGARAVRAVRRADRRRPPAPARAAGARAAVRVPRVRAAVRPRRALPARPDAASAARGCRAHRRDVGGAAAAGRHRVLLPHSAEDRVEAYYPSPMGATESLLTWSTSTCCARWSRTSRRCWSTGTRARASTGSCRSTTASGSSG